MNGSLFGTTSGSVLGSHGFVYKLDANGVLTLVYRFIGGGDGTNPVGVIAGLNGTLYGATMEGGAYNFGTVFEVTETGSERVLHSFGAGLDGTIPLAGLVSDAAGNLYGTTGTGGNSGYNSGTVFKVAPCGAETPQCPETVIYNFTGPYQTDGAYPVAPLIIDSSGNLYGTTSAGGIGNGTIFKVNPGGEETVLHRFGIEPDGASPEGGLVRDRQGNFYGTTFRGGTYGYGTVFRMDESGDETILYSFGQNGDGQNPDSGVVLDQAGNLYGTTSAGGAYLGGTIFEIDINGIETVLHSFNIIPDGIHPSGGLLMDAKGNLYGTTSGGAYYNWGTIFELTP